MSRHFKTEFPKGSSVTWDDVYRFTGNNFIGRRTYKPIMDAHKDAGLCLVELAEELPEYIPANQWAFCSRYNMTALQFNATVKVIAEELASQTNHDVDYWIFCCNNCWKLLEGAFKHDLS